MAEPNYNILNTQLPAQIAAAPIAGYQQAQAAGAQQMQNALNQAQLIKFGKDTAVENQLAELYRSGGNIRSPETIQKMYEISPKHAMVMEKNIADIDKAKVDAIASRLPIQREMAKNMALDPSPQNIMTNLDYQVKMGWMTPQQADAQLKQLSGKSPQELKTLFTNSAIKADDFAKYLEDVRHHGATERIQGAQLAETRRAHDLQYASNVVANTVTDNQGNVTQFNRYGQVIGTPGKIGKPSATFEKTQALQQQQQKDLKLAIGELEQATKDGGLIDQSTGSGFGRATDVAAGFVGKSTPGAIAIAKLKPIADLALKMVPRFEGPQSDKDTQSYKEAAGQLADPSLPTDIRKAAGREVLRLMKSRKGQFISENMANEGIGAGGVDTSNPLLK